MSDRRQDFELLQRFTRQSEQSALADLVRQHVDLVFATALRKVEDHGAAQEVAQNVFTALARKAWQFAPDDSLPAWLYKAALLESKSWLRGDLGRRRREQTAAELGTTMHTPEEQPAFQALMPSLDEALLSLREKDRTALLLRYYESQSLRDVGAAFGVSEDTAQKRVQSALEKLTQFFKEHGFKTASVAAAAAALQSTATSASATMVGLIVRAALQNAPPVLAGLGAFLARLATLSRAQTAAVCLVLAAVPLGWQLNEQHAAGVEVKRIHAQLLAAQNEHSTLLTELERLRANSRRLEGSLAQANDAATRAAASAQAFEAWKKKFRGLLTAADYRWSDDSPFARIPKSALLELSKRSWAVPFMPPGDVQSYARELMGLTPSERQSLEAALHRYFADVEETLAARIYETNRPNKIPGKALAAKVFVLPGLGEQAEQLGDQILAKLRAILGEERWPLVKPKRLRVQSGGDLDGILRLGGPPQDLAVWVETDDKGTLMWGAAWGGGVAHSQQGALSMALPQDDPDRTESIEEFGGAPWSSALRQRGWTWLQEQAIARLGEEARR
jgi:RNA polymerase sigma factor (sigma-70 family)